MKIGGHHGDEDFAVRGKEPKDEVQIYTWKDATLRELTDLVCLYLSLYKLLCIFLYLYAFMFSIRMNLHLKL